MQIGERAEDERIEKEEDKEEKERKMEKRKRRTKNIPPQTGKREQYLSSRIREGARKLIGR